MFGHDEAPETRLRKKFFTALDDSPFVMLGLEGVGLGAGGEVMVLDLEALAPEQVQRLEPVGTGVFRHHHAVKDGSGTGRHGCAPGLRFNGTRPIWGP